MASGRPSTKYLKSLRGLGWWLLDNVITRGIFLRIGFIVVGARPGVLFPEEVAVGSGEQSTLGISGGILSRSIGNAWITH
jgi:hypothetical protein